MWYDITIFASMPNTVHVSKCFTSHISSMSPNHYTQWICRPDNGWCSESRQVCPVFVPYWSAPEDDASFKGSWFRYWWGCNHDDNNQIEWRRVGLNATCPSHQDSSKFRSIDYPPSKIPKSRCDFETSCQIARAVPGEFGPATTRAALSSLLHPVPNVCNTCWDTNGSPLFRRYVFDACLYYLSAWASSPLWMLTSNFIRISDFISVHTFAQTRHDDGASRHHHRCWDRWTRDCGQIINNGISSHRLQPIQYSPESFGDVLWTKVVRHPSQPRSRHFRDTTSIFQMSGSSSKVEQATLEVVTYTSIMLPGSSGNFLFVSMWTMSFDTGPLISLDRAALMQRNSLTGR